jgi:hypothetical protein
MYDDENTPPPPMPGPYDPRPLSEQSPLYLPNLIVALIAAVGIVVGSLGPWITFLMLDRSNTDGDGKYTLVLGIIASAMLFVVLNLGGSATKTVLMQRLGRLAALAGVLSFLVGVIDAHEVLSRHVELFGQTIGPQIGWGLWLVLIASLALTVTAIVVVKQISAAENRL